MSTNARIGLLLELDNGVESIYTHWDGYPSHHGPLLLNHWNTRAKVAELLALGDLSVLNEAAGQQHDFDDPYDDPVTGNWCKAYGRDRGEEGKEAVGHSLDDWPDYGQEYEYLFTPGVGWSFRERHYSPGTVGGIWWDEWKPLTAESLSDDVALGSWPSESTR